MFLCRFCVIMTWVMKMDELKKRKNPRLQGFDYNSVGIYFTTICTKNRRCMLSQIVGTGVPDCPQIKLTKYGEIAEKYIKQLNDCYDHISVEGYVIMPNHIHILLFVKENGQSRTPVPTNIDRANSTFSKFISTFKRFCNKEYGMNIWQYRSNIPPTDFSSVGGSNVLKRNCVYTHFCFVMLYKNNMG